MTKFKLRLMTHGIKGELLSSVRILKAWFFWKALHWAALSLQWIFFNSEDWEFYRELRLGILRRLIVILEEMNSRETSGQAGDAQHGSGPRKLEPALDEAKILSAKEETL